MPSRNVSRALTHHCLRPHLSGALLWAGAVLVALSLCATAAHAQRPTETSKEANPVPAAATAKLTARPVWTELNLSQQLALQPLSPEWDSLSAAHKRKWLALVRNYARMTPEEQTVLHSRMTGWATLTQQQRVQARLNFADVKQVPPDERRAKWEAYQALSDEQKRALAESAPPRPRGAALPAKPAAAQKLFAPAPVPVADAKHTPRILLAPPPDKSPAGPPATMPAAPVKVTEPPTTAP
ncbi:MAG: DUF3106 domain-containing protein [Variovorax sp.]|nr:MAG: DUF3106 domain-containing protein [Variovorax sp.]